MHSWIFLFLVLISILLRAVHPACARDTTTIPEVSSLILRSTGSSPPDVPADQAKGSEASQRKELSTQQKHQVLQLVATELKKKQLADQSKKAVAETAATGADNDANIAQIKTLAPMSIPRNLVEEITQSHIRLADQREAESRVFEQVKNAKNAIQSMSQKGKDIENMAMINKDMYVRVMHNAKPVPNIPSRIVESFHSFPDSRGRLSNWVHPFSQAQGSTSPWRYHEAKGVGHKTFSQLEDFVRPQQGAKRGSIKGAGEVPPGGSFKAAWRQLQETTRRIAQDNLKTVSDGSSRIDQDDPKTPKGQTMKVFLEGSSRWPTPSPPKVVRVSYKKIAGDGRKSIGRNRKKSTEGTQKKTAGGQRKAGGQKKAAWRPR